MASRVQEAIRQIQQEEERTRHLQSIDQKLGAIMAHLGLEDAGQEGEGTADEAQPEPTSESAPWRGRPVADLELSPSLAEAVAEFPTVGDLSDHLSSGEHIPGVGEAKARTIREAIDALAAE